MARQEPGASARAARSMMASEAQRWAVTRSGRQGSYESASTSASWNSTFARCAAAARRRASWMSGASRSRPTTHFEAGRERQREAPRAAAHVEDPAPVERLLGEQIEEAGAHTGGLQQARHARERPGYSALKYLASGWWKTSAETDASGSIM